MCRQHHLNCIIHIAPFRVVIHLISFVICWEQPSISKRNKGVHTFSARRADLLMKAQAWLKLLNSNFLVMAELSSDCKDLRECLHHQILGVPFDLQFSKREAHAFSSPSHPSIEPCGMSAARIATWQAFVEERLEATSSWEPNFAVRTAVHRLSFFRNSTYNLIDTLRCLSIYLGIPSALLHAKLAFASTTSRHILVVRFGRSEDRNSDRSMNEEEWRASMAVSTAKMGRLVMALPLQLKRREMLVKTWH